MEGIFERTPEEKVAIIDTHINERNNALAGLEVERSNRHSEVDNDINARSAQYHNELDQLHTMRNALAPQQVEEVHQEEVASGSIDEPVDA